MGIALPSVMYQQLSETETFLADICPWRLEKDWASSPCRCSGVFGLGGVGFFSFSCTNGKDAGEGNRPDLLEGYFSILPRRVFSPDYSAAVYPGY